MGSLNADSRLAIAELVIYICFLLAGFYVLIRHGKPGFVGWGFFLVFCILRLTASGLQINSTSNTGGIINSVGISALLLTISGVIHEASVYSENHRQKIGWIIQLLLHVQITGGIALAAIGGSNLPTAAPQDRSTDKGLMEGGYLLLLLTVILLTVLAFRTIRNLSQRSSSQRSGPQNSSSRRSSSRMARTLACGAAVALPFAAVRVIYSVVYAFSLSRTLNPVTGAFAVKLVLISLVQIFASLSLLVGGILTRDIVAAKEKRREENVLSEARTDF